MNLLGDWVYPVALCLIVAALCAAAFITWRTPRQRWGLAVNMLTVTVASALVALGAGLILNHDNGWYPTLDDLFGSFTSESQSAGAQSGGAVFGRDPRVAGTDTRALPALPSPGQRIQVFDVPTSIGTSSGQVTVILPTDYFDAASATRAYPVLFAGHGMPGSPKQWYSASVDIRSYLDPLVQAHQIAPTIVAIPNLTPGGRDTECISGSGGPDQMETWLAKDVPAFLDAHLRAQPQRTGRAWMGISAGAWCGAMLTMLHPDTFSAAITLGGYFKPWWVSKPPWPLNSPREASYDLVSLARTKPPAVALWVQSSKRDTESWPQTQQFLAAARPPTLVSAVIDSSGGHTWTSWRPHISDALRWLAATVPGFAA